MITCDHCFKPIEPKELTTMTACSHTVHGKCMGNNNECPCCKSEKWMKKNEDIVMSVVVSLFIGMMLGLMIYHSSFEMKLPKAMLESIKLNLHFMETSAKQSTAKHTMVCDSLKRIKEFIEHEVRRIG